MVARPRQITIGTTATEILTYDKDRTSTILKNTGATDIHLGVDSTLTATNGFELSAGQAISLARFFGDDPRVSRFAISGGSVTMSITEEHDPKRNDKDLEIAGITT